MAQDYVVSTPSVSLNDEESNSHEKRVAFASAMAKLALTLVEEVVEQPTYFYS
jgi:hypothetical protein